MKFVGVRAELLQQPHLCCTTICTPSFNGNVVIICVNHIRSSGCSCTMLISYIVCVNHLRCLCQSLTLSVSITYIVCVNLLHCLC